MATHNDIATVQVGAGGPTVAYAATEMVVTVVEAIDVGMVGVPIPEPFEVLEVITPGIQGPAGLENVHIGTTPPENPVPNQTVWLKVL